jgi:hypothetical protein
MVTGIGVTGVVASMGAVARITHATALVAKLLASSPARHGSHPLPVLAREKSKKKRSPASRGRRRPARRARPRRNSKR